MSKVDIKPAASPCQ